jgi:hypothetical protein
MKEIMALSAQEGESLSGLFLRLIDPAAILQLLAQAIDPNTASETEWNALFSVAERALPEIVGQKSLAVTSAQKTRATLRSVDFSNPISRRRFEESLGSAKWAACALGIESENGWFKRVNPANHKKMVKRLTEVGDFAESIIGAWPTGEDAGGKEGRKIWIAAILAKAIALDVSELPLEGKNPFGGRPLNESAKVVQWATNELPMDSIVDTMESVVKKIISEPKKLGNLLGGSLSARCEEGEFSVRLSRRLMGEDFSPANLAKALLREESSEARLDLLLLCAEVKLETWEKVLANFSGLSEKTRSKIEGALIEKGLEIGKGEKNSANRDPSETKKKNALRV